MIIKQNGFAFKMTFCCRIDKKEETKDKDKGLTLKSRSAIFANLECETTPDLIADIILNGDSFIKKEMRIKCPTRLSINIDDKSTLLAKLECVGISMGNSYW